METVTFTEDQMDALASRTAIFAKKVLEAYNIELSSPNRLPDPTLEANAAIRALAAITMSVIASIAGDKDTMLLALGNYIDVLETASAKISEITEETYTAAVINTGSEEVPTVGSQEVANLGSQEVAN
jgi:hypothetical protein